MSPDLIIAAFWLILFLVVGVLVVLVIRRDRRDEQHRAALRFLAGSGADPTAEQRARARQVARLRDVPSGPRVRVEQRRGRA